MAGKASHYLKNTSPRSIINGILVIAFSLAGILAILQLLNALFPQVISNFGGLLKNITLIKTGVPLLDTFLGLGTTILIVAGSLVLLFIPVETILSATEKRGGSS